MKLLIFSLLISSTCLATAKPKVQPQASSECTTRRDLQGSKIFCPGQAATEAKSTPLKSNQPNLIQSDKEMAAIEAEMGPPPAALSQDQELRLE